MRSVITRWLTFGLLIVAFLAMPARSEANTDYVAATAHFEFHSNFWLNLHHYLFNVARDHDAEALPGHLSASGLSAEDVAVVASAAAFYRDNLIDKSLLFNRDLTAMKRVFIRTQADEEVVLEEYRDLEAHVRRVRPIYARHFWPGHRRANQQVLDENLPLAVRLEKAVFARIAELSQNQWPDHKVRVDITYVANWAGAYTTVNPIVHAVIRSSRWESPYDWIEILFHEPTHAMIAPDEGAVAEAIERVSGRLGVKPAGGLWHAILFYIAGTAVQEALAEEDIEYALFMFRNDVFSRSHELLRRHMPAYVAGEVSLERAIENILMDSNT